MGNPQPTTAELKRQLVAELDYVRAELVHESRLAKVEWNPAAIARRSIQKHRTAWIIGGVVTGFVALRLLTPAKIKSDNFARSDKKRGVGGLFSGLFMTFAGRAAMNFATTHLKDYLQAYLEPYLQRPGHDPSSHVASR